MDITWSNRMGPRSRDAWLLFIKGDVVIPFAGQDIPNIAVIRGTDYRKNGKWSHTTYRIVLAAGVRHIEGRDGWETGRFVEGLGQAIGHATPDRWVDVAEALGVSVPSAMEFLRAWRPKAAERLDDVDREIEALESTSPQGETDPVLVTVNFGGPTRRAISEGYWESPKGIPGYSGELRLRDPAVGWASENIEIMGVHGKVIDVKHASGYHGGYYAITVAVVPVS
jgi:hypothetical protein